MQTRSTTALAITCVALLSACSNMSPMAMDKPFSQDGLPDAVKVPAGHQVALQSVGVGEITYECRAKADALGAFAWVFVGPQADLMSRSGSKLGTYFGPPATWAALDGSKITGTQLAVAPAGMGNIPSQLVKANPAVGSGAMSGISYIQRVATQGGVAPASVCDGSAVGRKEVVKYQADYIFWKAA
ncbi:MAG: DUF3455 domain-containing protein [Aquabacterium sp.]|uniref:DUF3455 domain-containing protein n=1 Tax=Aquabacterium sp. TaxID=1872578 RepID=UPI002715F4A6|nr:DUF3455 domain-containing protein [Aquabacterium sp.]MDO9003683.1 DUF3455 domain-containing protein [Aquabacterium sp.]